MADTAAAPSRRVGAVEVPESLLAHRPQTTTRTTTVAAPTTAPTTNPIFQILFSDNPDPETKRVEIAKFLTVTASKEENKTRLKAREELEDWLQSERQRMETEIIALTDTETFSELQGVYQDLNQSLIDFNEKMKPLTDILEAIYDLRVSGKTIEAFQEIQADKAAEQKRADDEAALSSQLGTIETTIGTLRTDIATLGQERGFFGFGGVTEDARKRIAAKQVELTDAQTRLDTLQAQIENLQNQTNESALGELAAQKNKLRDLLDIKSDAHKARQKELVDAALKFVSDASTRIGSVRGHLNKMTDQIDAIYDANTRMSQVYGILTEGIKDATTENKTIRATFDPPAETEGVIAKMTREEKQMAVDDHIKALDTAAGSTIQAFSELTKEAIGVKTKRDANVALIEKTRIIHTQGVAGIAERLSSVLSAVSMAALGESSAMAKDTLTAMMDTTNKIVQKEVIQVAAGVQDMNADVKKAIDDLGDFGEVLRTSTEITREGLAEVHENIEKMQELAATVRDNIRDASSVHSDTAAPNGVDAGQKKADQPAAAATSPFGTMH